MGLQEKPNLYPKALQLKLYQAFIFSIPVLFSIILFLLFYLFYLKRRASSLTSHQPVLPRTFNQPTNSFSQSTCGKGVKAKLTEKLPKVLFDEELGARDSQCCVCLGEFQIKEELIQMPSCKHVFHVECILHWLRSSSSCPICRCLITSSPKLINDSNNNNNPRFSVSTEPLSLGANRNSNSANAGILRVEQAIPIDEMPSTSESTCIRDTSISS